MPLLVVIHNVVVVSSLLRLAQLQRVARLDWHDLHLALPEPLKQFLNDEWTLALCLMPTAAIKMRFNHKVWGKFEAKVGAYLGQLIRAEVGEIGAISANYF